MADIYIPDSELLGRRRFPDDKSFRLDLFNKASILLGAMLDLLPSNYPQDFSTNLAQLFRVLSREFSRLQLDVNFTMADKQYTATRIQFLQQILGERLFLYDRLAPAAYNDETFRDYLISLKNAYLAGSTKSNIESTASHFTHTTVRIKELYLEARKPNSSYDVSDTNMMIVDVLVDDLINSGRSFEQLKADLDFFINLIKPAHVLYDTHLIWTEQIDVDTVVDTLYGDTGAGCVPVYDLSAISEPTVLALQVTVLPNATGSNGRIDSINAPELVFYLTDSTRVITEPSATLFFNASTGKSITFNDLAVGQYIRFTSLPITGEWQFWYTPVDPPYTGFPDLSTNARYYRSTFRLPAFQENVKKVMDDQGRFPLQIKSSRTTICDRWVQDSLQPLYEDMRSSCADPHGNQHSYTFELQDRMGSPRLSWPWIDTYVPPVYYGSPFSFTMPYAPLTDVSGHPASITDISVWRDSTSLTGVVSSVDASNGVINLITSWDGTGGYPHAGESFRFAYNHLTDGTVYSAQDTFAFGISAWQIPQIPLVDASGNLAGIDDVAVSVDSTAITNAVLAIRPLLGHVILDSSTGFWLGSELGRIPQSGDEFGFTYWRGLGSTYSSIFDDPERLLDSASPATQYTLVFDAPADASSVVGNTPAEIGYRYRAYLLHHSSVLNSQTADSTATLLLNHFQKPAFRASLANDQDSLNHMNLIWSPEFLYDTSSYVLNDQYLDNGLDPVLKLNEGTPPFQKTFSYQPTMVYHRKVQDIRRHHSPLIYSDLLLKEFRTGGDLPLSSICDAESPTFRIRFEEQLPRPEECPSWLFFDTAATAEVQLVIPSDQTGVPQLRNPDYKLRSNLILRDSVDVGVVQVSYTEYTTTEMTVFQLPETVTRDFTSYGLVAFPALPIMRDASHLADSTDVEVYIDGTRFLGIIDAFDPVTGDIILDHLSDTTRIETFTLTSADIYRGEVELNHTPTGTISLTISGGPVKHPPADFYVIDKKVIWRSCNIEGLVSVGDILAITYLMDPLEDATIEFRYDILNHRYAQVEDDNNSRILDRDVFGSLCPEGGIQEAELAFHEYLNFLDDNGSGIRIKFLNKDTYQIEDHVFTGPLFETYDTSEDQIACPDSFDGALIRLPDQVGDAMECPSTYDFVEDDLVRFRKKTFRELMPDRTFRITNVVEMMPL